MLRLGRRSASGSSEPRDAHSIRKRLKEEKPNPSFLLLRAANHCGSRCTGVHKGHKVRGAHRQEAALRVPRANTVAGALAAPPSVPAPGCGERGPHPGARRNAAPSLKQEAWRACTMCREPLQARVCISTAGNAALRRHGSTAALLCQRAPMDPPHRSLLHRSQRIAAWLACTPRLFPPASLILARAGRGLPGDVALPRLPGPLLRCPSRHRGGRVLTR